ncbi:hypothetical protein CJ030_MR0G027271 [Morella rubra]|uniref:C2 domain-containing protein n=1 Tax=Morella rubra TaxID=262757 RepID=A0A6A1UFQ9_9ROSI|nr:hypothetical protein CJ030_MR0G027271 [Morella rubra]
MDSPQSVVSPFRSSLVAEPEKQKSDFFVRSSGPLSKGVEFSSKEAVVCDAEDFMGVVEVYVHQARDIHNICIYHKQDVYAKLCLTSDPENTVSTKTINGGGRNPVFNDNVRLNVRTIDSSVKCEIWMLSRVRNYLEDQLLGFALVPLSEVLITNGKLEKEFSLSSTDLFHSPAGVRNYLEDQLLGFALVPLSEVLITNGKLEKEFSLSSTDLFHSPAGFVQLSLSYNGVSPEVMSIAAMPTTLATNATGQDTEISESVTSDLDKIEFPDPKIVNEDQLMVSEYFGLPCSSLDSQSSDSLAASDAENHDRSEAGVRVVESFSTGTVESLQHPKVDSPPSSVSTNGVSSPSNPASSESSDVQEASKSSNGESESVPKQNIVHVKDGESASSGGVPTDESNKPVLTVNMEPEQKVVQQDIVDMYMKSMQQFTESLAKMKLPLDMDSGPANSGNSSSDQNLQASKNTGSRVFYGSRAFF